MIKCLLIGGALLWSTACSTAQDRSLRLWGNVSADSGAGPPSFKIKSGSSSPRGRRSHIGFPPNDMLSSTAGLKVRLRNGRELLGHLDLRTTEKELWLRIGSESLSIIRPIRWDEVAEIHLDGQPVPVGFLREFFELVWGSVRSELNSPAPSSAPSRPPPSHQKWRLLPPSLKEFAEAVQDLQKLALQPTRRIILEGKQNPTPKANTPLGTNNTSQNHAGPSPMGTDMAERASSTGSRVAYLSLDAWLGQWDEDVEADGLVVEITPCDAAGRPMPVHGMLEVTLAIPPRGLTPAMDQKSHRQRWVQRVRVEDFSAAGSAQYRFAFRSAQNNPEWNLDLAGYGAVTAQLSVPGQGVFSATAGCVRVRPFSPVRDRLQQSTGRRFFPWEQTQP